MADNYLEKKMEELQHSKRFGSAGAGRTGSVQSLRPKGVLYNKRVLVTGGAGGIGRAIVKAFCDAGCRVAFCDINAAEGKATAQATGSRFYHIDVTDVAALEGAMEALLTDWHDLDIVINNVGVSRFKPFTDCELSDFEAVLRTNLYPVFVTSRKLALWRSRAAEAGAAPAYGRIINIASTRATMSEAGTEAYSASKGAIVALTHSLMMSLAPYGVTVNCLSPGWIECHNEAALRPEDHTFHPSLRVGKPQDIARMAIFLAHPDNDFVNGENIVIDGGVTRKMIYPE